MLDAAAELDADPGWLIDDRLPVVATLVFAGLRVHELAALRWGDLDFATSSDPRTALEDAGGDP